MGRLLVALLLIVAFCLGASFSYYNWTPVEFHYLAGTGQVPLIALLLAAFVLGLVVMWLLTLARAFTTSREARRQQRQIRELEAELKSLRSLPLQKAGAAPTPAAAAAAAPPPSTPPSSNANA